MFLAAIVLCATGPVTTATNCVNLTTEYPFETKVECEVKLYEYMQAPVVKSLLEVSEVRSLSCIELKQYL